MTPDSLESTYRRLEFVFGGTAVSFTAFVIGTTFAMMRLSSEQAMQMIVVLTISVALSLVGLLVFGFRSHRWTLGESALTIALAGGTVWGLLTLDDVPVRPNFASAIAILVLLPLGAAWMLRRSLRRRLVGRR